LVHLSWSKGTGVKPMGFGLGVGLGVAVVVGAGGVGVGGSVGVTTVVVVVIVIVEVVVMLVGTGVGAGDGDADVVGGALCVADVAVEAGADTYEVEIEEGEGASGALGALGFGTGFEQETSRAIAARREENLSDLIPSRPPPILVPFGSVYHQRRRITILMFVTFGFTRLFPGWHADRTLPDGTVLTVPSLLALRKDVIKSHSL